ncbi:Translation initiation factor 1A [Coemansia javaensis]|uniref:Translation initiation factor 1A n=1 Tax=Coemansia javaensis TaxID=2761396 RepID=A0A9W8LL21_9FUNG|nr:Translation initiation factor 1A [Coemansia javaensis]
MDKSNGGESEGNVFVEAPKQLAKDAEWLLRRCTKPSKKEYQKIVQAVVLGFIVMGFVGYFTKLIHIPINNIINVPVDKRELQFKGEDQEYGVATKTLGNCRMEVTCIDGKKVIAHIRGAMRKKVWVNLGDHVLVALRDFQQDRCDIILKYTEDEVTILRNLGQIPEKAIALDANQEDEDGLVTFEADKNAEVDIDAI